MRVAVLPEFHAGGQIQLFDLVVMQPLLEDDDQRCLGPQAFIDTRDFVSGRELEVDDGLQ